MVERFRKALQEAGKPFPAELPIIKELYVAPDRRNAIQECRPWRVSWPGMAQDDILAGIELLGREVLPEVRRRTSAGAR